MKMKMKKGLLTLALLALIGTGVFAQDDKVNAGDAPEKKTPNAGAVQNAALGYQLVLLGDKNESSTMLLAAAELLGGMKQSDRDSELAKVATDAPKSEKAVHDMSFGAILDRAVEYASEKSKPFVQAQVDELRSGRGLAWELGKNLESVNIQGFTYKVIDQDIIGPGQTIEYTDIVFEGKKPAQIIVIGDDDGDIDLWIFDGAGNKGLIDNDTDATSRCVTEWHPKWQGPFTAKLTNVGNVAEQYIIIANW